MPADLAKSDKIKEMLRKAVEAGVMLGCGPRLLAQWSLNKTRESNTSQVF